VTTLSFDSTTQDIAPFTSAPRPESWATGCTVVRRGPLTTIALDGDIGGADIAGLDRAAALAMDLPGLEVLVIDLCDLGDLAPELAQWLLRVETRAARAGASMVVLAEPGRVFDWLRTPEASSLRVLRGSASLV
jgi:hypothetical protein